jgi:hypothetical protein
MEGIDWRNMPKHGQERSEDPRRKPNEGQLFFEEKLMKDPRADEARRMLSHDGGQASPRTEHY